MTLSLGFSGVASAQTLPETPEQHHRLGVDWVAAQLDNEIPLTTWSPDWGVTLEAAIALHSAGIHSDQVTAVWDAVKANLTDVIDPFGAPSPGRYARVIMLASALGDNPTNVEGVDLIDGLFDDYDAAAGLFGSGITTWDGTARQALAILSLIDQGVTVPEAAISWLIDQQCDDPTQSDFYGSWMMDVPATGCEIDNVNFVGPDTNATAMAIAALQLFVDEQGFTNPAEEADALDRIALGVDWLSAEQNADGGWGLNVGHDSDPNSTGVVLQGLHHLGLINDPMFDKAGETPFTYLASLQLICDVDVENRGAFEYPLMGPGPDMFATVQAVGGMSGGYLPTAPTTPLADFVLDCEVPTTTTTTSTTSTTLAPTTTSSLPVDNNAVPTADPSGENTETQQQPSAPDVENKRGAAHTTLARTGAEPHSLTITAVLFMLLGVGLIIGSARPWKTAATNHTKTLQ